MEISIRTKIYSNQIENELLIDVPFSIYRLFVDTSVETETETENEAKS